MNNTSDTLVSVGIPAYNAEATLDETILSVRRQSHANLQIFVVDDGSTDATATVAQRHANQDPRVTVIRKQNGGVASARNAALERARGVYFAAVDADDLWHPEKIRLQIASLQERDAAILSYTWYAYIDGQGCVLTTGEPDEEGNVIARMCRGHLVGNGSSTMVLTSALRDIGGWDPDPRLDGNEDYKAFFTLAERGEFVVVRSHLLGYRQTRDNKSSKSRKMLASYDQVVAQFRSRHPEHEQAFTTGRQELIAYLFDRAVLSRHFSAVAYLFAEAFDQDPARAYALLARTPLIIGRLVVPLPIRALWRKQNANRPRRATRFNSSDIAPEVQAPIA